MKFLARYRPAIISGLREALAGVTPLRAILRYHVGLEDEAGNPVDALGKLLRPAFVLFAAEELGGTYREALPAAVALELIHNFSLIHDDIQDRDRMRRGRPTVWVLHGIPEAINAGDLMYTIAISVALSLPDGATSCLVRATDAMIEGQSLDLGFESKSVGLDEYLKMIDYKTGALLRCAFELGSLCAGADEDVLEIMRRFGHEIGRAFQIRDDVLGIWGNGEVVGKPQGSDIRHRKKSYPVAAVFERVTDADREKLERIYVGEAVDEGDVAWVIALLDRLGIREEAEERTRWHLAEAHRLLSSLALSEGGREDMDELMDFLARREK